MPFTTHSSFPEAVQQTQARLSISENQIDFKFPVGGFVPCALCNTLGPKAASVQTWHEGK